MNVASWGAKFLYCMNSTCMVGLLILSQCDAKVQTSVTLTKKFDNMFHFQFQVLNCSPVWRGHVLGREWSSPAQSPLSHISGEFHPLVSLGHFFLVVRAE